MATILTPPKSVSEITLACGLFTLSVPDDWTLEDGFPFESIFRLPDGGTISVTSIVYDEPERMERKDFAGLFTDLLAADAAEHLQASLAEWSQLPSPPSITMSAQRQADDGGWYRHIWRSIDIWSPLIRCVTWNFEPASTADGDALAAYADALHPLFQRIRFATEPTDLDLVPETKDLKIVGFGKSVVMRMPVEWEPRRKNPDGTGRHLVDEPVLDRWTLWIDWDLFINKSAGSERARLSDQLIGDLRGDTTEARTSLHDDKVVTQHYSADEGGPIRIVAWHRFAVRGPHIVLAHFSLVVDETKADLPELLAVRDLVGREALNAVLIPYYR